MTVRSRINPKAWRYDDQLTVEYYKRLLKKYGDDIRSLDWGSRKSQRLRFSVLAQVGDLNGSSVLDVGCGMGDFLAWLKENGIKAVYTGIDITPGMIDIAHQSFPDASFTVGEVLHVPRKLLKTYDYVFASGLFYLRRNQPAASLQKTVRKMFSLCRRAVAFNSLSGWAPRKDRNEFYADPSQVLTFCRTLTPWVVLRHDYHLRDFTIYMYKGNLAA